MQRQSLVLNTQGLTLIEVLIAGILMTILVVGALVSLKSTTGFTTRTGRFTQSGTFALELGEPNRNAIQPGYLVPAATNSVTLMEVPATRQLSATLDPCATPGVCPGGSDPLFAPQMNRVTVQVNWNEPKD